MASSGRFQSQILSSLSQFSLRVRDRVAQTVRHAQFSARWSAQVVLYPVYVTFQSARVAVRQLQQAQRRTQPRLQAVKQTVQRLLGFSPSRSRLASDTPIRETLQAAMLMVPTRLLASVQFPKLPTVASDAGAITVTESSLPQVIGLACRLDSHAIVLIAKPYWILDVLTAEQQHQLRQCMARELADYWYHYRALTTAQSHSSRYLPLPKVRPTMLPVVRQFRRLMRWMQTSPLAIATNLFDEATLVHQLALPSVEHLIPDSPSRQLPTQQLPANSGTFHLNQPQLMGQSLKQWLSRRDMRDVPNWMNPDFESLTVEPNVESAPSLEASGKLSLRTPSQPLAHRLNTSVQALTRFLQPNKKPIPPSPISPIAQENKPRSPQPSFVNDNDRSSSLAAPAASSNAVSYETPWIETEATVIGYEKHPLERFLNWLDKGMVWLETLLQTIWRWLRGDRQ